MAVVGQQIKISKLERQGSNSPSNLPTAAPPTTEARGPDDAGDRNTGSFTGDAKPEHRSEEAEELAEKAAKEKMDEDARVRTDTEAARRAEREAKENAEREAEERARAKVEETVRSIAENEAMERMRREAREREKLEREEYERVRREENEKAERETKEKSEREAREREEEEKRKAMAPRTTSPWGSTGGKNDRSRKTSALSQKKQRNEWAAWDTGAADKQGPSDLPPIFTSSVSDLFDGAGNFDFLSAGLLGREICLMMLRWNYVHHR